MTILVYNSGTQEAEAGGSQAGGQPGQHSKFQTNHGYTARPCLRKRKRRKLITSQKLYPLIPSHVRDRLNI
jgi:hypothetical protein